MLDFQFRTLTEWTGPKTSPDRRRRGSFAGGLEATYRRMRRELELLRAETVVIQVAVAATHIRNDGLLRASAPVPSFPGIILTFEGRLAGPKSPPTPLRYKCDHFRDWQTNLRAIVLTLEHLRGADRYGVTASGEQYQGWAQLPGPGRALVTAPRMTVDEAARVLAAGLTWLTPAELVDGGAELVRRAFVEHAKVHHPDRGGDAIMWAKINDAREVLERHHRRPA